MLTASLLFSIMGLMVKTIGPTLPASELVFFRNTIGLIFLGISIRNKPLKNKGGKIYLLIFRGLIGTLALLLFFYNAATISLAEATIYVQTSPIFIAIFSYFYLRENISLFSWGAILIGFVGIYFVLNPGKILLENFTGILNGVFTALAYTSIRGLSAYYEIRTIVLSFLLLGIFFPVILFLLPDFIFSPYFLVFKGIWRAPNLQEFFSILVIGITAFLGQIYVTKAYGTGKGGIVGIAGYSTVLFSIPGGIFLGDQIPNLETLAGIILIIFSGAIVSLEKNK